VIKFSHERDGIPRTALGETDFVKLGRIRKLMGWAEKQAEVIVDAFLADGEPEDLLRLEQAIAAKNGTWLIENEREAGEDTIRICENWRRGRDLTHCLSADCPQSLDYSQFEPAFQVWE
jgi:hypothetical protein